MLSSFPCPVCSNENWQVINTFHYSRSDRIPGSLGSWQEYVRLRRRVLFEVWCPNADRILLQSIFCRGCGFVTYSPRPSETDVDAKYRFLQVEEKDIGGQDTSRKAQSFDRKRAGRVYRTVIRYTGCKRLEVLDFGGGNGKLLVPFSRRGHLCHLIDYTLQPLPGINKVGDTLDDIPSGQKYQVILCSHVLEHVANPSRTVRELLAHLMPGGVIYGEVPLDIWGGIDISYDPVTHINFFNQYSFEELFRRGGLRVLESKTLAATYGARRLDVVMIVAQKDGQGTAPRCLSGVNETRRLLNPTLLMRLYRLWRLRRPPTFR